VAGRFRLTGGTHTGPDGRQIHHGESFDSSSEDPVDGPALRGRVVRSGLVFTMPEGYDRIDWSDGEEG
jgi:hypothetical protein